MPRWTIRSLAGCFVLVSAASIQAADVNEMLKYTPRRKVVVETPAAADQAKCRVESEQRGQSTGWVLFGPQGQILRRFIDAAGAGTINEFRYYDNGIEVYREADTNGDSKIDSFRYLGPSGTRWGLDTNADGRVDTWKQLSAEEATLEAVQALIGGDAVTLQSILLSDDDARAVGLADKIREKIRAGLADVPGGMRQAMTGTKTLNAQSEWERFDCSMRVPSCLPAMSGKWDKDIIVYENVMAMTRNGQDHGFVQIGEMVRVGDVWKLTRIPRPLEGDNLQVDGGFLMQESLDGGNMQGEGLTPEAQKLVEQLKLLDDTKPGENAAQADIEKYNLTRADLLTRLAKSVTSASEKELWWRQLVEGVAANTQMGVFPNGAERLAAIEKEIEAAKLTELIPFTRFRTLLVTFAAKMAAAPDAAARQEIQNAHLTHLSDFVKSFPTSDEAPEAMWQVSTTLEFNGKTDDAKSWYNYTVQKYGETAAGLRSKGALTRLDLKGKTLNLTGNGLDGRTPVNVASLTNGKVVAIVFWATWFKPSVDETPQLVELYKKHQAQGFEIVGINLDVPGAPVANFLRTQGATWPQIQDPGGMENGKAAVDYGIIAPGTMFLVGKDGKVISNSASLDDLKKLLPELLAK